MMNDDRVRLVRLYNYLPHKRYSSSEVSITNIRLSLLFISLRRSKNNINDTTY